MGTFCTVIVTSAPELDTAQRLLDAELAAIDLACSRFRDDSEISAVNRADGAETAVSPLFAQALATALRAAEVTDGDVDPTCGYSLIRLGYDRDFKAMAGDVSPLPAPPVPAGGWRRVEFDPDRRAVRIPPGVMLDFGATAKALSADRAARRIAGQIGGGVLVNLGGDIAVAGQSPQDGWLIGLEDGITDQSDGGPGTMAAIVIHDGGLATSGLLDRKWRRGDRELHHILVPETGQPAEAYWAAVTVAAASCVDANIATTASIIRGRSAPAWLEGLRLPARLVRPDGVVFTTGGWPQ